MAGLSLKHIYKIYPGKKQKIKLFKKKNVESKQRSGDFLAVRDFNMEIEDGEFIVFVGPSGCGKSTTLRMIAGLEEITAGELYIGDRLVNDVEPKDRDIAMVFQSYALYPHMTARRNIEFGLKLRTVPVEKKDKDGNPVFAIDKKKIKELQGKLADVEADLSSEDLDDELKASLEEKKQNLTEQLKFYTETPVQVYVHKHIPKDKIAEKVEWAAKVLGVEDLLDSKPKAMSGGQRQRIALGRAIVREPKVMLLDEPLSNLDAKLRTSMRAEIVKLHEQLKTTFIYVTHDQIEAMTMGTRIVVMKLGVVQQIDTPTNLFDYPDNKFVAGFIGTPQMNFFDVTVERTQIVFADGNKIQITEEMAEKLKPYHKKLTLGIRGEDIKLDSQNLDIFKENRQQAVIDNTEIMGNENNLYFEFGGTTVVARVSKYEVCKEGDNVGFVFITHKMHFFDSETEEAIML